MGHSGGEMVSSKSYAPSNNSPVGDLKVWDRFVRLFHWGLILSILVAFVTADILGATWITLHIWAGAVAAGLVLSRLIWGFTGSTYARFASFAATPANTVAHLKDMLQTRGARHLGHNPLGGWMIFALLGGILATVAFGFIWLGGVFKAGPLKAIISYDTGISAGDAHAILANFLLALIFLHIAGAVFESLRCRENLPASMITGRKQRRPGDHLAPAKKSRPMPTMIALAALIAAGGWGTSVLMARPVRNAPVSVFDPAYASACGDCHGAFNPSLLRAENWVQLMQTLPDHFGEDASLDSRSRRAISDWLIANAADDIDSKPAHVLARTDYGAPFTVTKSPFWIRRHRDITEATFKRAPIYSRANCAACHADAASGWFYPANTSIPKEPTQ